MVANTTIAGQVPDSFIPLNDVAERSGKETNVLRKHHVREWAEDRLALKDDKGHWWCDPKVIAGLEKRVRRIRAAARSGVGGGDTETRRQGDAEMRKGSTAGVVRGMGGERSTPSARSSDAGRVLKHHRRAEQLIQQAIEELEKAQPRPWQLIDRLAPLAKVCRELR